MKNTDYIRDLVERVGWTAAEAGLAVVITESADWHGTWMPFIAAGLAVLKGAVAKHIGNRNSAAIGA